LPFFDVNVLVALDLSFFQSFKGTGFVPVHGVQPDDVD
jgi:hypothetical protein